MFTIQYIRCTGERGAISQTFKTRAEAQRAVNALENACRNKDEFRYEIEEDETDGNSAEITNKNKH